MRINIRPISFKEENERKEREKKKKKNVNSNENKSINNHKAEKTYI